MSPPHLLQIVPSLAGGSLARTTLDAAHAVIAAGGSATVASAGGLLVPELLRLRGKHLDLPTNRIRCGLACRCRPVSPRACAAPR